MLSVLSQVSDPIHEFARDPTGKGKGKSEKKEDDVVRGHGRHLPRG